MRKNLLSAIILILIVHCTLQIEDCMCQWVQGDGIYGGGYYVKSLAANETYTLVGTYYNGIFWTTNNGQNWIQSSLNNEEVRSLAVNGSSIFAGTGSSGVYLSTNNGHDWTQTSLNNRTVYSIAISGSNIFAGTSSLGVYYSSNNGQNWTQTSLNNKSVFSFAVNGSDIYAGANDGVYLTTNNGQNWTQIGSNNIILSLTMSGNYLFAGTSGNGIYYTSNNGQSWTNTLSGHIQVLAVSGSYIYASRLDFSSGVYYSIDNGIHWTQTSLNNKAVYALTVRGTDIFAGTDPYGVCYSSNNGTSWIQTNYMNGGKVNSFATNSTKIYAGAYNGGFLSTNNGKNWIQIGSNNDILSLAISGNYLFAGTNGNGVYYTTNDGQSWTQTSLNNKTVSSLAVSGSNIYAGVASDGVYTSTNNGQDWTQIRSACTVYSLNINGIYLFAGTYNKGIYYTTNNGLSWTQKLNFYNVYSLASKDNLIYAGTANGLFFSTNDGQNWSQISSGNSIQSISLIGSNILVGTAANGIYLSTNNGNSWTSKNEGLGQVKVNALIVKNDTLFAGTENLSALYRPLNEMIYPYKIWSGAVSSDWTNTSNWRNGSIPSETDSILIPATQVLNDPIINSSLTFKKISIEIGRVLTINSGGILNLEDTLTCNGTIMVNGILSPNANKIIKGSGTITGIGTVKVSKSGSSTDDLSAQYIISNKVLTNLTIEFAGTSSQKSATSIFGNLKINNTYGVTLENNTVVNGNLDLNNGNLEIGSYTLNLNNNVNTVSGTLSSLPDGTVIYNQNSDGQLVIEGTYGNLTLSNYNKILPSGIVYIKKTFNTGTATGHTITGNTIEFNGSVAQNISGYFVFNNLNINNSSGVTASTTITVNGTLKLLTGTFNNGSMMSSKNGELKSVNGYDGPDENYLTLGNGATIERDLGALTVAPNFGTSVNVTYSGTTVISSGYEIPSDAGTLNSFTLNKSGGVALSSNCTVNGICNMINGNLAIYSNTLTLNSTLNITSGTFTSNNDGSVIYNQQSNGQAVVQGTYGNLTFSNFNKTLPSGMIIIKGIFNSGTAIGHTITDNTIEFNGNLTQNISSKFTFNNLIINKSGGQAQLGDSIHVNGTLNLQLGILSIQSYTLMLNGEVTKSSGSFSCNTTGQIFYNQQSNGQNIITGNYGKLTFNDYDKILPSSGTIYIRFQFLPGNATGHTISGSTIEFSGGSSQTIPAFKYNNLVSSSTGNRTLASSGIIYIANTYNPGTNTYTVTGSTVEFNGTSAQSITGLATFNNLNINNSSGVTLSSNTTVNGTLKLLSGTFNIGSFDNFIRRNNKEIIKTERKVPEVNRETNEEDRNLTKKETGKSDYKITDEPEATYLTLANGAVIERNTGILNIIPNFGTTVNIIYSGTTQVTTSYEIPSDPAILNNLTINKSGGVALSSNCTVNGTMNLLSGVFSIGSNTLTLNGSCTSTSPGTGTMISLDDGTNTGTLAKKVTGTGSFTLPVGDIKNTAGYSPVTINFTSGSFNSANVTLSLYNSKHPQNNSQNSFLNRYWVIIQSGISNFAYNMNLTYEQADVNGSESNIYLGKHDGSSWTLLNTPNLETNTFSVTGLTSFSTFTGGEQGALNVEMVSFSANINKNNIKLTWTTVKEENNQGFEVQRKNSGKGNQEWNVAGFISGNGNSNNSITYTYEDKNLTKGKYNYRLKQIDYNGNFEYYNLASEVEIETPKKFELSQNYPNPFNPRTKIDFTLPADSRVSLKIYDITGREVAVIINNEFKSADYYSTYYDAGNLSSGILLYRLVAGDYIATKKMLLIK
jgi:hypothetical protein